MGAAGFDAMDVCTTLKERGVLAKPTRAPATQLEPCVGVLAKPTRARRLARASYQAGCCTLTSGVLHPIKRGAAPYQA
eukprot:618043-Prymnesium_polylepis.1